MERRMFWMRRLGADLVAMACVACCASTPTLTSVQHKQAERNGDGESWSYAHLDERTGPLELSNEAWHRPDPRLLDAGLPQIKCRLLDVAISKVKAQVDGKPTEKWWATYFVKIDVEWRAHDMPAYVALTFAHDRPALALTPAPAGFKERVSTVWENEFAAQAWPIGHLEARRTYVECLPHIPECQTYRGEWDELLGFFAAHAPSSTRRDAAISHGVLLLGAGPFLGAPVQAPAATIGMRVASMNRPKEMPYGPGGKGYMWAEISRLKRISCRL